MYSSSLPESIPLFPRSAWCQTVGKDKKRQPYPVGSQTQELARTGGPFLSHWDRCPAAVTFLLCHPSSSAAILTTLCQENMGPWWASAMLILCLEGSLPGRLNGASECPASPAPIARRCISTDLYGYVDARLGQEFSKGRDSVVPIYDSIHKYILRSPVCQVVCSTLEIKMEETKPSLA